MESIYSVSPAWFAHQSAQVQKGPTQMMRACKNSIFGKIRRRQTGRLVFAGSPVDRTLGRNSHLDHLKFPDWRWSRGGGRSSWWEAASSTGSQLETLTWKDTGAWIYGDKQAQVVGDKLKHYHCTGFQLRRYRRPDLLTKYKFYEFDFNIRWNLNTEEK